MLAISTVWNYLQVPVEKLQFPGKHIAFFSTQIEKEWLQQMTAYFFMEKVSLYCFHVCTQEYKLQQSAKYYILC